MNEVLTKEKRALLDAILDILIPANDAKNIPAAGCAGVADFIAKRASENTAVREAIADLINRAELHKGDVTEAVVRQLETDTPDSFALLLRLTYMGYYSRPDIRGLLGLAEWPVHPKGYEVPLESGDFINDLTDPVRARGAIYREA